MKIYKVLMVVLVLAIGPLFYVKLPNGQPLLSSAKIGSDITFFLSEAFDSAETWAERVISLLPDKEGGAQQGDAIEQWLVAGDQPLPNQAESDQIFYRWTDGSGVEHLSSEPSSQYPYREVGIAANTNVLSFGPAIPERKEPAPKSGPGLTSLTEKGGEEAEQASLADLLDNVDELKEQLENRNDLLDEL
ncbi:hypothetical protein SIN8267_02117 [Sinobacterium norvegicum]|uniref:DUF4124 domain-containing protein n=1 Tax=Sinobacterium norvegicum TaxID=1641715 RepID=A0ABM9AGX7_9GAMM|nr:hypothetical protein [Sinobacterium norvegicum]CAH0992002.1 hypothetical protein SIN8267_02117 [Sinobacterium norvegicum]